MSKKMSVQIINSGMSTQPAIMLSESIVKQANVPSSISLHFGSSKHTVQVIPGSRLSGLRINSTLANLIGLAAGDRVRVKYRTRSQALVIGPLIGILLPRIRSASTGQLFGKTAAFCKEMSDACRLYGAVAIFFAPEALSSGQTSIQAWAYRNDWRKSTFPLPDVVYNRLTSRKSENSQAVQQFMRDLKARHHGKIFNECFLNKHEVFHALKKEPGLHKFLPESYAFKDFAMLKSMCQKYAVVFLKPVRGSLGKGILRIVKRAHGGYDCQYTTVNGTRTQSFNSLSNLYKAISGKLKTQKYQIQQGLQLVSAGGRPIDFRAVVQKDGKGEWGVTSVVARIAGNQRFVSNIARGGTLSPVKAALLKARLSAAKTAAVHKNLRTAALAIAQGLDRQRSEHFGELGVDLAVSVGGKVQLLEVNSKPSKDDNTPLSDSKIRPSVKLIVQYCTYLANL